MAPLRAVFLSIGAASPLRGNGSSAMSVGVGRIFGSFQALGHLGSYWLTDKSSNCYECLIRYGSLK